MIRRFRNRSVFEARFKKGIEWNPDAEEHLMNLRDAILDLF